MRERGRERERGGGEGERDSINLIVWFNSANKGEHYLVYRNHLKSYSTFGS